MRRQYADMDGSLVMRVGTRKAIEKREEEK